MYVYIYIYMLVCLCILIVLVIPIAGFSVRLYGSCASGSALTISDVNVALDLPESTNRTDALDVMMKTLLEKSGELPSLLTTSVYIRALQLCLF